MDHYVRSKNECFPHQFEAHFSNPRYDVPFFIYLKRQRSHSAGLILDRLKTRAFKYFVHTDPP